MKQLLIWNLFLKQSLLSCFLLVLDATPKLVADVSATGVVEVAAPVAVAVAAVASAGFAVNVRGSAVA